MIKQFFLNALNSWATSTFFNDTATTEIYTGLLGLLDTDPATAIDWKVLMTGVGILALGLLMRDWTKALVKSERHPDA
jgi:hypothetical protein